MTTLRKFLPLQVFQVGMLCSTGVEPVTAGLEDLITTELDG